jgi:hypothetical protein
MAVLTYNWTWQQGEDLIMSLVYKAGPAGAEAPVDLTGYSVRMDLAHAGAVVHTFNSADLDPETEDEATLGSDGTIQIVVDRALTLTGGTIEPLIPASGPLVLTYDMFLRSPSNRQTKILRGTITVESSITQWA